MTTQAIATAACNLVPITAASRQKVKREKKSHLALHINPDFQGDTLKSLIINEDTYQGSQEPTGNVFKYYSCGFRF